MTRLRLKSVPFLPLSPSVVFFEKDPESFFETNRRYLRDARENIIIIRGRIVAF